MNRKVFKVALPIWCTSAICALLALFLAWNFTCVARAEESTSSTNSSVSVSVKATGYTDGTTTTLEKNTYTAGETVNLTWKGAVSGTDLVIPISISYGNTKIDIGAINKIESLQSDNKEYEALMGQKGTMTEYDKLKDYVSTEHVVTLGKAFEGLNVYINYAKVSPVYRLYNMVTSEHMFTTNKSEYDNFVDLCKKRSDVWIGEGIDWLAPTTTDNTKVVHRLYNKGLGAIGNSSHYYTSNEQEIANLIANHGWSDDGESVQYRSGGTTAIYTCYNEALKSAHHYTSSQVEWQGLKNHGWALEEDKNGSTGVFQCLTGTSWSFENNYYRVEHYKQNLDGTYTLAETQYVSGKAGDKTNAVAKAYAGFVAGDIASKTIMNDDSTVVRINYSRTSYTLELDGNGKATSTSGKTYKYGEKIDEPDALSADGQDFAGWYLDPERTNKADFNTLTMTADGLTLYAKWNAKPTMSYTVAHVYQKTDGNWPQPGEDGYVEETLEGIIGDETAATACDKEGFSEVTGWKQGTVDEKGNTTLRIEYTRNKHYMNFDFGEFGENPQAIEVYYGQEITTPEIPNSATHHFAGWYTTPTCDHDTHWGHDGESARLMPDSDLTLYAHWTEKDVFWVTFETNGGSRVADEEVIDGDTVKQPEVDATSRTGWTFVGWYDDENFETPTNFDEPITASKIIYAKWQGNSGIQYVIKHVQQNADGTFDENGAIEETLTGTAGEVVSFTPKDYVGFQTPDASTQEIEGDGTTVVIVKYERKAYSLKFNANGHGSAPDTMEGLLYGSTVHAPSPEPDERGWIFEGWYKEQTCENEWLFGNGGSTMPDSDVELFAKWKIENYKVTFDTLGGSTEEEQTVPFKGRATRPTSEPQRAGYAFVNWYNEDMTTVFDFASEITQNTTIYALWEDLSKGTSNDDGKVTLYDKSTNKTIHATITFDDDGDASTPQKALSGATFEVDENGGVSVKLPSEPNSKGLDVTVTLLDENGEAITEAKSVQATDSDEESRGTENTDAQGQAIFAGENRGKTAEDGKVSVFDPSTGKLVEAFVEYDKDGTYTPLKDATLEITVEGKINVSGTSEAAQSSVKVTLKDKESSTNIDGRDVKWTDDGQSEPRGTKQSVDGVVTFVFYTLTYDVDGGSALDAQKVPEGKVATKPTNPTKSGVYFLGWYESDKTTLYDFTQPLNEDKTIYARWTDGKYTVIFHKNDEAATGEMANMSRTIGDNKQLTGNGFSKVVDGVVYGMEYWTTNPDGSGKQYRDKFLGDLDLTEGLPINLYAQWTTVDINPYWIAASSWTTTKSSTRATNKYYTNPETSVVKTQSEIQEDMRILSDTAHTKYSASLYDKTLALYTSFMENDDYHLYTKLTEKQSVGTNDYAEFRIIQVGGHESIGDKTEDSKYNDGSILTFEQTHLMPKGYKLFENSKNEGGWSNTTLKDKMNSGEIFNLFNTSFTNDIAAIEKWNRRGSKSGKANNELYSSADQLWITSVSELNVSTKSSYGNYSLHCEGDTYWFWKNRGVSGWGSNTAISNFRCRDGSDASGASPRADWWTRTPYPGSTNQFGYVGSPGYPMWGDYPSRGGSYIGVVVCFSFDNPDTSIVHFDSAWGSNVDGQTVNNGEHALSPTTPTKEGYTFAGWYSNKNYEGDQFDFENTAITSDVTLYAKWEATSN